MKPLSQDLSIFKKLNLINEPVAVKFLYREPKGIDKLDKKMAICEIKRESNIIDKLMNEFEAKAR